MMSRLARAAEKIGEETLLVLGSLFALLISFTAMVLDQVSGVNLIDLVPIYLIGFPLGWWVGGRRLRMWAAGLFGLGAGFLVTLGLVGQLYPPFIRAARAFTLLSVQVSRWRWIAPLDFSPYWAAMRAFFTDLGVVMARLVNWGGGLVAGNLVSDRYVVGLLWSGLIWLIVYWVAWTYRRWRRPLVTLSPPGAVLGAILAFAFEAPNKMVPFLGAALLLLLVTHLGDLRERWEAQGVDYPAEVWLDLGGIGLLLIVILLGLALIVPSINWDNLVELFQRENSAVVGEGGGPAGDPALELRPRDEDHFQSFRFGGLPREHLIGSGPELQDRLVMAVSVVELTPDDGEFEPIDLPALYWRGFTFERYSGQGWFNGPTENLSYSGVATLRSEIAPGYHLLLENFEYYNDFGGVLHVAGYLARVDMDYEIAWRVSPREGPDDAGPQRTQLGDIFGALVAAERYQALAMVPRFSEASLRSGGALYPAAIQSRYLALPDSVPPRVYSLARELTATEPTPYDQAVAIEAYLRTFPYTLDLPAPPMDRDVVDYFLFDLQKGYCDYYATAMVVLARAAGLPARLVMGYAPGNYDIETNKYLVSEADAHSWAEIYFPGTGWIEFEPTAGLPALSRPSTLAAPLESPLAEEPARAPEILQALRRLLQALRATHLVWGISGLILGLAGLYVSGGVPPATFWRLRQLPPPEAVRAMFQYLYQQGRRLELFPEPGITANEFEIDMQARLTQLAQRAGWRGDLGAVFIDLGVVTKIHTRSLFSPRPAETEERVHAFRAWLRLNRFLIFARFWQWRIDRKLGNRG